MKFQCDIVLYVGINCDFNFDICEPNGPLIDSPLLDHQYSLARLLLLPVTCTCTLCAINNHVQEAKNHPGSI